MFFKRSYVVSVPVFALLFAAISVFLFGCGTEPLTTYQIAGHQLTGNEQILILPFMDTRTFSDPKDPHLADLPYYARDILARAVKAHPFIKADSVLTPAMTRPTGSMTVDQVAALGREHGADIVVSGQIFSFTETRAASIPPRAGMFIRVVSAKDGALLFVGDHYQAAMVPMAEGGRDLQAKIVAEKLIKGFASNIKPLAAAVGSSLAWASILEQSGNQLFEEDAGKPSAAENADVSADDKEEGEAVSASENTADSSVEAAAVEVQSEPAQDGVSPAEDANAVAAQDEQSIVDADGGVVTEGEESESVENTTDAENKGTADDRGDKVPDVVTTATPARYSLPSESGSASAASAGQTTASTAVAAQTTADTQSAAEAGNAPQPTMPNLLTEINPDPTATKVSRSADAAPIVSAKLKDGAKKVLLLPYNDRNNPNNLIPNTGGGEVVTALYAARLSMGGDVQLIWPTADQATHDRLLSSQEAIDLARTLGADYVIRGQVVEFRRAQSVPSFYSVVISTAVLAAQILFAEMSGVDVATEVYRVSDGACVMARRDMSQQKYVVQAEKTVRRLAAGMAPSVISAINNPSASPMTPNIDTLTVHSMMSMK